MKKNVMTDKIGGFGGFNFFLPILHYMCNWIWWICENFRIPMKMIEKDHYFQNRFLCKLEDFFPSPMGLIGLVI